MRRKSFDAIVSVGGLLLTVVLVAAGALLLWAYSFANGTVTNQLSAQKITFPAATAFAQAKPGTEITPGMIPYLAKYAGQQLTTGAQAEAYANHFIAVHLQEIGGGKTYSELSGAAMAQAAELHDHLAALAVASDRVARQTRAFSCTEHGISQPGHHRPHGTVLSFDEPPVRTNMAAHHHGRRTSRKRSHARN